MPRPKGSKNKARAQAVYLYVPETFDASLIPELRGHEDSAHWMIHKVIAGGHQRRHDPYHTGLIHISRQTLKQYIPIRDITLVRDALVNNGVIVQDQSYLISDPTKGLKGWSQSYGLTPPYAGGLRRVEVQTRALANSIRTHRIDFGTRDPENLDQTLDYLLTSLRSVDIDAERADQILALQPDLAPKTRKVKVKVANRIRKKIVEVAIPSVKASNRMVVEALARGEVEFSRCQYGRVHSLVSRLETGLRDALLIDGHPLAMIDIRNSQLTFLLTLLLRHRYHQSSIVVGSSGGGGGGGSSGSCLLSCSHGSLASPAAAAPRLPASVPSQSDPALTHSLRGAKYSGGEEGQDGGVDQDDQHDRRGSENGTDQLSEDEYRFKEDVLAGVIYDKIMVMTGYTDRRKFKGDFFRDVLFGDAEAHYSRHSTITKAFRASYPRVWAFIIKCKQGEGPDAFKGLARDMQRAESAYMIGRVCGRLAAHHAHVRVVTIHDSVLCLPKDMPLVKRIMAEEFLRLDLTPTLKEYPAPVAKVAAAAA